VQPVTGTVAPTSRGDGSFGEENPFGQLDQDQVGHDQGGEGDKETDR
jgi:hypothetical protein